MPQRRKKPPSWPRGLRPSTSVDGQAPNENKEKKKCEDNGKEIEVYCEPVERDSNGIIIGCVNMIFEKDLGNIK